MASRAMSLGVENMPPAAKTLGIWRGWTFPPWMTGATTPGLGVEVGYIECFIASGLKMFFDT